MRAKKLLLAAMLLAPALTSGASDKTLLIELDPRSGALPEGVGAGGAVVVGGSAQGGGFYWAALGVRAHLRYKPTILGDEEAGDFCDAFGFCQGFLQQVEFAGGAVVRF
jgi:hypothetical protein